MIISKRNSSSPSRYDDSEIVVLFVNQVGVDYVSTIYDVIIEAGVYAHLLIVSAVVKLLLAAVIARSRASKTCGRYLNGFWYQ